MNAGALLLLAPNTGNRVYEELGLDSAYREFCGWALFGGGQILLGLFFTGVYARLQQERRTHENLSVQLHVQLQKTESDLSQARELVECTWEKPPRLVLRFIKLRRRYRAKVGRLKVAEQCRHRLEIEVATLRRLKRYLNDAWNDEDNAEVVAQLQQEMARLRGIIDANISREQYEKLLSDYHELKGHLTALQQQARQPKEDLRQILDRTNDNVVADQAVS